MGRSDLPAGPFTDAVPIAGADRDAIDPAALVDDDGSVFFDWGQFHLRGARLRIRAQHRADDAAHGYAAMLGGAGDTFVIPKEDSLRRSART